MSLQLGDVVPDFSQDSSEGTINFHEWLGDSWGVLFSHPKDFTPVCTTELARAAYLKPEFDKRNAKIIGVSVDSTKNHQQWFEDIADTQNQKMNFPVLADHDRRVANAYGMIHPNVDDTFTVRTVFVIDHNKKLRLTFTYPPSTGRNFDEILRAIDSLQLTDNYKVATPVDWQQGDDVIILPSVNSEDAQKLFPQGWDEKRPYLRLVKQPS